jgi:hypothetical protein
MNEWGALFFVASIVAVFSIPLIMLGLLMRVAGRISTRTLVGMLAADSILWVMAGFYWWVLGGS